MEAPGFRCRAMRREQALSLYANANAKSSSHNNAGVDRKARSADDARPKYEFAGSSARLFRAPGQSRLVSTLRSNSAPLPAALAPVDPGSLRSTASWFLPAWSKTADRPPAGL